jgi:pentatricopeptide repeat protein
LYLYVRISFLGAISSYDNRGVTPPHAHRGDDEQKQNKRKLPPDHGSNYVPGAGDANQAPQSMDHFRRGRRERTEMRRREVYCPNENPRRQEEDSPRKNPRQEEHQSLRTDRPPSLKGIDLNRFMDDLCNQRLNVFKSLDSARQEYWELFHSGKVMTAVIAAAARRRQVRLAQQCWEWMDRVGMEKNVYHYNSMISVMEKDKNFREAMNLLKEMESRNIPKNEVT